LPEYFCDEIILVRNFESHTQISDQHEPWEAAKRKTKLDFERAAKSVKKFAGGKSMN